jgi:hypothetical protein
MYSISREPVPPDALLKTYRGGLHPERWAKYGDCFALAVERPVSLAEFVYAFYTSRVFRIERLLLRVFAGASSSDAAAQLLANGSATSFALWRVGERSDTQLLMCDHYELTRSWFRVVPLNGARTLLQFGSAVASNRDDETGATILGGRFSLLLGFHLLYSQILLSAAKGGLMRRAADESS